LLPFFPEPSLFSFAAKSFKIRKYKTIILPAVLYGCKSLSVTLREEHCVRVFEKMIERNVFGPKRNEVTGRWRKLNKKEFCDF
jgi:hypothetical protein